MVGSEADFLAEPDRNRLYRTGLVCETESPSGGAGGWLLRRGRFPSRQAWGMGLEGPWSFSPDPTQDHEV